METLTILLPLSEFPALGQNVSSTMHWLLTCCYTLAGKVNSSSPENTREHSLWKGCKASLLNWRAHVKRSCLYLLLSKKLLHLLCAVYVKVAWMIQNLILCPGNSVFCSFYCLLSTDLHELKLANSEKHLAWLARNAWAPSQTTNSKDTSMSFGLVLSGGFSGVELTSESALCTQCTRNWTYLPLDSIPTLLPEWKLRDKVLLVINSQCLPPNWSLSSTSDNLRITLSCV